MDKRVLIKSIKESLELEGFKTNAVGAGAVSLIKDDNFFKEEIVFSYLKYLGVYRIGAYITGWKSFRQVEEILERYYKKHGIGLQNITIFNNSRRYEELSSIDIANPEDIMKVLPHLQTMVYEDILPFFEKYDNLIRVNDRIEDIFKSEEKIGNFIYSPIHPRIMVIKRLTGDKSWQFYSEKAIEIYKEQSTGKYQSTFAPIYAFLPELYEELKRLEI